MKAEYIDHMGNDLSVVNAARVSFDKVSVGELIEFDVFREDPDAIKATIAAHTQDGWSLDMDLDKWSLRISRPTFDDMKLIRYLAKHDHWTPFAHTSISLRMQAPVPIRTQCFKHKQGFVENEESRRYISSRPVLFVPDSFRAAPTGGAKQGSSGVHYDSKLWLKIYKYRCDAMVHLYEQMIADGVAPEQARFVLPQGCEVQWIWTGSLFAYANFVNKRTDPHAQKEIRDLAEEAGVIIQPLFPVSWAALTGGAV